MRTLTATCRLVCALAAGCAMAPLGPRTASSPCRLTTGAGPSFSAVQRPDAKQVREIYMNPAAAAATASTGFGPARSS